MKELKSVQIELVGVCNATCPYCTWRTRETGKQHMDASLAFLLIEECERLGVEELRYHHTGESLLHKDLVKILDYGCDRIKTNILSTNCSLLDGAVAHAIARIKNLQLVCSIHWVMGEVFADRSVNNLLAYLNRGFLNEQVTIQMLCDVNNEPNYQQFVETFGHVAEEHDRVRLHFKQPVTWPTDPEPNLGFKPAIAGSSSVISDQRDTPMTIGKGCEMPYRFLAVMADGTVAPCCVGQSTWDLPNAMDTPLGKIWDSEKMQEIREAWKVASYDVPCGFCIKRKDC